MADIYEDFGRTYQQKITKKTHNQTLPSLDISLDGATEYMVRSEVQYRPDLISFEFYGQLGYEDYITIANKLTDPIKDYKAGKVLYIPTLDAIIGAIGET